MLSLPSAITPVPRSACAAVLGVAVLFAAGTAQAHEIKLGKLVIHHPWSRQTPTAAGFMTITNTGTADDRLVGATSEISPKAEIQDGTGKMLAEGVAIPAGATVKLKPKSVKIVFVGVSEPLAEEETFNGTLSFEKAGTVTIDYEVVAPAPGGN